MYHAIAEAIIVLKEINAVYKVSSIIEVDNSFARVSILEFIGDCTEDMFRCSNGSCLNRTRICDFTKDCAHGEDEGLECGACVLNS